MRNFIIVVCAVIVAVLSSILCASLRGSGIPGERIFSFFFGMIGTVSGGSVLTVAGVWVHERLTPSQRPKGACV